MLIDQAQKILELHNEWLSARYRKQVILMKRVQILLKEEKKMNEKKHRFLWTLVIGVLLSIGKTPGVQAQSEFQLQPVTTTILCSTADPCTTAGLPNVNGAILHRPTTDVLGHSHVAIEITHDSSSYINFMGCTYLAQRGYTTLCADGPFGNSTFANQFAYYGLEQVVPTVASAINYLRNVSGPGIDKVIIFGHSGGGSLQPFYENVAENGPGVCQACACRQASSKVQSRQHQQRNLACGDDLLGGAPEA